MKAWRLAQRFLRSDLRSGELRALLLSIGLAVAALSAVAFFTDRVDRGLARQGAELLAADLAIETGTPPVPAWLTEATRRGLESAEILEFPSVVFKDDQPVLVQVKGIGPGYPLRGQLLLEAGSPSAPPAPDRVWVEPRLLQLLEASLQGRITLGGRDYVLDGVVTEEPDRGGDLVRFAPRLLLSLEGVERSGLIGPASRVKYRLLLAGEAGAIDSYRRWIEQRLPPGTEVLSVANARPELRAALERGGRFLSLAALCAALLAGAAVALSTRLFVHRQTDAAAMLRCLGAPGRQIFLAFAIRLSVLGLCAALAGVLVGFLAQFGLTALLGQWFGDRLPAPGLAPAGQGLATGLALLLGFALPPLLRLRQVPPLRALRRDIGLPRAGTWVAWVCAALSIAALVIWQAGDLRLATRVLGGVLTALLLLVAAARGLVALLVPLRSRGGSAWRYGLAALARRPGLTALQAAGFGLGILALLLLAVVRVDLLAAWRASLPPGTPQYFMLNIQADEVAGLERLLTERGIQNSGIYPMIRGRLVRIGAQAIDPEDYESPRARRLAAREFNLSAATRQQADNRISAGRWWRDDEADRPWFSVEQGLAESLGIALGDQLTFDVAGQLVTGEVTSLRTVQWDSFNVNFFVTGTPGLMQGLPGSFITSFHLGPAQQDLIGTLARQFPSASVLDVQPLLARVRSVIDRGVRAVEAVFLFTLVAGVLVLYAAVQASRDERAIETAVLRTLGASRRRVLRGVLAEFATLGLLAGGLAASMATAVGYVLARQVFDLPWTANPWLWLAGTGLGAVGVALAGWAATATLVSTPPAQVLRSRFG